METLLDLSGRVAIVTGGGTGIGRRTAHVLAARGADIVLAARKAERLEQVATDVRLADSVTNLIDAAADRFGGIDILVNNAGGAYMFPLKDTPPDRWRNAVDLNLTSAYLCAQAAYPHLRKSPAAAIVNISSMA